MFCEIVILNQDEDDESSEDVGACLVHALGPVHTKRKSERKRKNRSNNRQKRSMSKRQTSKKIFAFARSKRSFTVVFPVFMFIFPLLIPGDHIKDHADF